jgi:hypothetical protein
MFKKLNLNLLRRPQMSTVLVQDRIRRLVDSGLRGSRRPAALTSKLKKRAKEMDDPTLTAMERVFFGFADKTRLKILKLFGGAGALRMRGDGCIGPDAANHFPPPRNHGKGGRCCFSP